MVIDNLDFMWAVLGPRKTDSPLFVYANAVLTFSRACKFFQPVARQARKVLDARSRVQDLQPFQRSFSQSRIQGRKVLP